jgi:hexosaminidase
MRSTCCFRFIIILFLVLALEACTTIMPTAVERRTSMARIPITNIIPLPDSIRPDNGSFVLSEKSAIYVDPATTELQEIGQYLANKINTSTGYNIQVLKADGPYTKGNIYFTTVGGDPALGDEGYTLTVTNESVIATAYHPAGLFWCVQTIRQLLPAAIESSTIQAGPWTMPAVNMRDVPRFPWRGAMLDVARHFFSMKDVKRFIDLMAYYKLNRFHFHLTDDQGWRLMINTWPNLTLVGGSTQVGGGTGGYYTQADYSDIVAYAQKRYITLVPEVDIPGHTNAALASYPVLNCNGVTPPLYTDIGVGFSSLCVNKDTTYTFVENVVKEICAITPGAYFHIGGDEALKMTDTDYVRFIDRVKTIVQSTHKQIIGWGEISQAHLLPTTIVQHWKGSVVQKAVQQGLKVIMSPASKLYLDMKYNTSTVLGQNWAGYVEVKDAYNWDPADVVTGVSEENVLGVEAPLWTETIQTMADIEYMTYPRLAGIAEIGWSQRARRNWTDYQDRLADHGIRLTFMGVNYYKSPQILWK